MGKKFYPDIHYQEKVYNQLVFKYQGEDLKSHKTMDLLKSQRDVSVLNVADIRQTSSE